MALIRSLITLSASALLASKSLAAPNADALPWAKANPQAQAAASAFADAYAEAIAIAHPDPEAYAYAASADDCASISCHAACGLMIIAGQDCSEDNSYHGPYNTTCLCASNSEFNSYYASCMDCGWTLWKYYGGYLTSALEACSTLSTEPTGTLRCSTTLTDSYTIDTNIQGCSYLGDCTTTTSDDDTTTTTPDDDVTTTSPPNDDDTTTSPPNDDDTTTSPNDDDTTTSPNDDNTTSPDDNTTDGTTSTDDSTPTDTTTSTDGETSDVTPTSGTPDDSTSTTEKPKPTATEPVLDGELVDGEPEWTLTIPGTYSPGSVALQISRNGSLGSFEYSSVNVFVNDEAYTDVSSTVTSDSIVLSFDLSVESSDYVTIVFDGKIIGGTSFTSNAALSITTSDSKRFGKRSVQTWNLSKTITLDDSTSSSDNGLITSTTFTSLPSTTVITVTSCEENKCTDVPITTGVTVITETTDGIVTSYTTYCPLPTSSTGVPETTTKETESTVKPTGKTETTVEPTVKPTGGSTETSVIISTQTKEGASSSQAISTYEGGAVKVAAGTTFAGLLLSFLFI